MSHPLSDPPADGPRDAVADEPDSGWRTEVRRLPELAVVERADVERILDAGLVAHVGFVAGDRPYVLPMAYARIGTDLFLHGSVASRLLRALGSGTRVCLTVTLLDGIVLARSVFEHSINYRSVVVLGTATTVTDPDEKYTVLEAFTEKLLPGRWADARPPTRKELRATGVLSLPIDEASAKVRTGAPDDGDSPDAELDVWAGHIPLVVRALPPVTAPDLKAGLSVPAYAKRYRRPGLTDVPSPG